MQLNCVVMKGLNDDEICDFVRLTEQKVTFSSMISGEYSHTCIMLSIYTYMYQALDVRFIEYMPFNGNRWNLSKFVPYRTMLAKVMGQWEQLVRLKDQPSDTSKVRVHSYVYTCRKERKRVLRL